MLFVRILNFIKGYLVISISGRFAERFINICNRRGIRLWDMKYQGGEIIVKTTIADYFRIRDVARITSVRTKIKKRYGLGFWCKKYRRRWPIIFGVMIFAAIIYWASTHVMSIDIVGNERIPYERIYQELESVGLKKWSRTNEIVTDRIRNEIMIMDDDVSWLGINVRGSRVYVEVAERIDDKSIPHEDDEICNVVALKDGVIEEIRALQGQGMVKRGDGVRKGDLLISGITDGAYGTLREVHAYGEVIARTEYRQEADYPLVIFEREYKNEKRMLFGLNFFGTDIDLFSRNNIDYSRFEETKHEYVVKFNLFDKNIEVGGNRYDFVEYKEVEKRRTVSEVVEEAERELNEKLENAVPSDAKIISKTVDHNVISGDTVRIAAVWYCEEDIAEKVPIKDDIEDTDDDKIIN